MHVGLIGVDQHSGTAEPRRYGSVRTSLGSLSSSRQTEPGRWAVVVGLAVLGIAGEGWLVAHDILGVGGNQLDAATTNLVQNNLFLVAAGLCLARAWFVEEERTAWFVMALGAFAWFPAETLYHLVISRMDPVPFPSITDAFWLASYPCFYAGLVLLARSRLRRRGSALWLDGLTGALAAAAIGAAVVLEVVLPTLGGSLSVVATNLAYPLADLILIGFVVGMVALSGWRPGRTWTLLGFGLLFLVLADSIYLIQSAQGSYFAGAPVDALWTAALLLVGAAAWQDSGSVPEVGPDDRPALVIPSLFVAVAVGILAYDHFVRVNLVAVGLAVATLLAAVVRTALAFRELRNLAESRRQAHTDDLTGLANRRAFTAAMTEAFSGEGLDAVQRAVLLVDLDRFKEINDTLGHPAGDHLLEQIGPRLAAALDPQDFLARLGGDEFGVLLAEGSDAATGERTAVALGEAIAQPFVLDGISLRLGASVGIAVFPSHGTDPAVLLRCADVAMYQAKGTHKRQQVYAAEHDAHSRDRLVLADELRGAIAAGQLDVYYQPQADLCSARVTGVEALIRWRHPQHGMLPPDSFLPMAEQTGLMRPLTALVLERAVAQCRAWQRDGLQLTVAVNLSATNLLDTELASDVATVLDRHQLHARWLCLEITENQLMSDPIRAQGVLAELRRLGVRLAVDDFGTGYSSLAYLRQLDIDEVKIDKSFVMHMHEQTDDAAIVRSTIDLAHALRLSVVAEGVETSAAWDMLNTFGAETAQGFLLSRPLPAEDLQTWLAEHKASQNATGQGTSVPAPRPAPTASPATSTS